MTDKIREQKDRIKLAEAMGGEVKPSGAIWGGAAHNKFAFRGSGYGAAIIHVFNPFTDANDAYAVHQHFMADSKMAGKYQNALDDVINDRNGVSYEYPPEVNELEPWDWPRAALKVIDDD